MSPVMSFMAAASENGGAEGGFYFQPETSTWLASQVVVHCHQDTKVYLAPAAHHCHHYNHYYHDQQLGIPSFYGSKSPHFTSITKCGKNWVPGGQRMQAVILDSAPKSRRGTGVFLPQQETGSEIPSKNKKSDDMCATYAPVLLPGRVIQALNLNVHALGVHISPKDLNRKRVRAVQDFTQDSVLSPQNKIIGIKLDEDCVITTENQTNSSLELCLPNEWTY